MSYEFFAGVYDSLTENVRYSLRAEYICSLLRKNGISGGLLLDLACGTGSLSVELAKKGFSPIAADLSQEMLSIAQEKALEAGVSILFLQQDMRSLDLYGTVDCAVCSLDSINHLTKEEDVLKTFKGVSLFMNDGGIFIFDVNTPYKHREILGNNSFIYDCEDVFCAWQNSLLQDEATVEICLDFFVKNGESGYDRYSESFCERAYEKDFLLKALCEADFEVIGVYEDMTEKEPDERTQRAVFAARRKKR